MASPNEQYTPHMMAQGYAYPHHQPPPPMYGEDQVPMSVQMPSAGPSEVPGSATLAPAQPPWEGIGETRGTKREKSDDGSNRDGSVNGDRSGEELGFGDQRDATLWQE